METSVKAKQEKQKNSTNRQNIARMDKLPLLLYQKIIPSISYVPEI